MTQPAMIDGAVIDTATPDSRQAARDRVLQLILEASDEELYLDDLKPETSLRDELDLTSMQAITLVMDLEDAFGIEVEDQEIERLESVGDVLSLLDAKLAGGEGPSSEANAPDAEGGSD